MMKVRICRRITLGVCLALVALPAMAQDYPGAGDAVAPIDPIDVLSAHLRTLAASPRNYAALIGAGDAALQVGDPNAALGFFARAEQVDPRSGKAKAGLASALVALEKPSDALPLFAQAIALGVAEAVVARDRGLAYDLRGDTRAAQRDYALAIKRNPDDETVRRYALSLGIAGQRAEAMSLLDPLLRRKDQSAWRARAFILAMTGDVSGANGIARQVMPANLAAAMTPFLTRLATLNPADRAHAVNFGTMPTAGSAAGGVQLAAVQIGDPFTPIGGAPATGGPARGFTTPGAGQGTGTGLIPAGEPLGPKPVRVAERLPIGPATPPRDEARVVSPAPGFPAAAAPGFSVGLSAPPPPVTERFARIGPVDPAKLPPEAREGPITPVVIARVATLPAPALATSAAKAPVALATPLAAAPAPVPVQSATLATPVLAGAAPVTAPVTAPGLIGPPAPEGVTVAIAQTPPPEPVPVPTVVAVPIAPQASRLAAILEGVTPEAEAAAVALPSVAEIRAQRRLALKKAEAAAAATAAADADKAERASAAAKAKANPARLWVQVATGSNTRGLAGTWGRIRDGNTAALKGKAAYSVAFKATNRLIVGPVKSAGEARAIVNALAKGGVSATTYSSEAGQEVTRVSAK